MGQLIPCSKKGYQNEDAINNAVYYTLNATQKDDPTEHAIHYSGIGVCGEDIDRAISEFESVQKNCRYESAIGTRVYHEFFTLSKDEVDVMLSNGEESLFAFAAECASIFYNLGYQVIYIIRYGQISDIQIHFLMNTVNYNTYLKWYREPTSASEREDMMNQILQRYLEANSNM